MQPLFYFFQVIDHLSLALLLERGFIDPVPKVREIFLGYRNVTAALTLSDYRAVGLPPRQDRGRNGATKPRPGVAVGSDVVQRIADRADHGATASITESLACSNATTGSVL